MAISLKYRDLLPPGVEMELEQLVIAIDKLFLVEHNEDGTHVTPPPATLTDVGLPIGTLVGYGGIADPSTSWFICDGRALSRGVYSALFTTIGTAYGAGDGSTTFNIPDYRGKFIFGKATAGTGSTLGGSFGAIDHVHTGPSHTHPFTTGVPSATTDVQSGAGTTVASSTHTHTGTTDAAGAGSTGTANPPGLASNIIILVA